MKKARKVKKIKKQDLKKIKGGKVKAVFIDEREDALIKRPRHI